MTSDRVDRIEYVRTTSAYITDYIKFGDTKAGAILGLVAVIAEAVAGSAPGALQTAAQAGNGTAYMTASVLAGVLISAALTAWHCVTALSPRTEKAASLNSFPDVAHLSAAAYVTQVSALPDDAAIAAEYSKHNWTLSNIAVKKFNSIGRAVGMLRVAILSAVVYALLAGGASLIVHHVSYAVAL
jgi:hypothetical protein